jgi:hypothetical protein
MKKTTQTPNCCIRKTGRDIARIAFELETPICDDPITPDVFSKNRDTGKFLNKPEGFILSGISKNRWIVFAHVRNGDVVIVRWKTSSGTVIACSCFEITNTFALRVIKPIQFKFPPDCISFPQLSETDDRWLSHLEEIMIKRLFSDRFPTWIKEPLGKLLDEWRIKNPALFVRVAPRSQIETEIALLVRYDPQRALSEYKDKLDRDQFLWCLSKRPDAALRHTFERIPRPERIGLVRTFSTIALNYQLDNMTEKELEVASEADAMTAFNLRHFLEDRRHAIVLSKSYTASFFIWIEKESELSQEIIKSVIEHPRIWHRSHHRSFAILFGSLQSTLGIRFSGKELLELSKNIGLKLRTELQLHIGSKI